MSGAEVFGQPTSELGLDAPGTTAVTTPGAAAAAAVTSGLIGTQVAPGAADAALQQHRYATDIRQVYGVTGAAVQSAHVGPTSFLRSVLGVFAGTRAGDSR